jgi:hypothetical protein
LKENDYEKKKIYCKMTTLKDLQFVDYYERLQFMRHEKLRFASKLKAIKEEFLYSCFNNPFKDVNSWIRQITDNEILKIEQIKVDKFKHIERLKLEKDKYGFELYDNLDLKDVPKDYFPAIGIEMLNLRYHKIREVIASDILPESGFKLDRRLKNLIRQKYPQFRHIPDTYTRPLGSTLNTFIDFNADQTPIEPLDEARTERVLRHVKEKLGVKPYKPLAYRSYLYFKTPQSTGTGYYNRKSIHTRAHAQVSSPEIFKTRVTSKGHFINATFRENRWAIHAMKNFRSINEYNTEDNNYILTTRDFYNQRFFRSRPTVMYTRNHISKRSDTMKTRPVYCVDDLFIIIEIMLFSPALAQIRREESCIMQGLETIRGANAHIDKIAQKYNSYVTLDYSGFDQTVPHPVINTFFEKYIPSILITDQGYTSITIKDPNKINKDRGRTLNNLLLFIKEWYYNMIYITTNGYAYRRTCAGIPSGLLITQFLDSYCNLFMIIYALCAYGFNDDEISEIIFLVMGDDNCMMLNHTIIETEKLFKFVCEYVQDTFHMKCNLQKCIITRDRAQISTLSYECNNGFAKRPYEKMVAQLIYPERGMNDKLMSYRAIGAAYASCGCCKTFYEFAMDVYLLFLPYMEEITPENFERIQRYATFGYEDTDDIMKIERLLRFPTFEEILKTQTIYAGALTEEPRWQTDIFNETPYFKGEIFKTLEQWRERYPNFLTQIV